MSIQSKEKSNVDIETAKKLMQDAIKAMIDCGLYKVAQVTAVRSHVAGQQESVMTLLLGESTEVLQIYAQRLSSPTAAEIVEETMASDCATGPLILGTLGHTSQRALLREAMRVLGPQQPDNE